MEQPATTGYRGSFCLLFALLFLIGGTAFGQKSGTETIARFRELYGNIRDYKDVRLLSLNGKRYILAYWYEDNSPLQVSVHILRYSDDKLEEPVFKVFAGDVSEEVEEVVSSDLTGDGRDELIFLSRSGQIKIVRVLEDRGDQFVEIFENGGSEVTLTKETREIWVKSKTAGKLEIYRWDLKLRKFTRTKTRSRAAR